MKRKEKKPDEAVSAQAEFLSVAMNQVEPGFLIELTKSNPELVFGILQQMDPEALAEVVNSNPEVFRSLFGTMPRAVMRRLLTEQPDLIFGMLRSIDPEIHIDMMGLEE